MFASFQDVSVLEPVPLGLSFPGLRPSKGMTALEKADKVLVGVENRTAEASKPTSLGRKQKEWRTGGSGSGFQPRPSISTMAALALGSVSSLFREGKWGCQEKEVRRCLCKV